MFGGAVLLYFMLPPHNFPKGEVVTVPSGVPFGVTANRLQELHYVRSQILLKICVLMTGGDKKVAAGDYVFKDSLNTCSLASRLTHGISGVPQFRAVITEGMSNKEIATLLVAQGEGSEQKLSHFDEKVFLDQAQADEGYLFPDTYFFGAQTTAQMVEETMRKNFDKKIAPLTQAIEQTGHSLHEIITMASILEKEARTPEDMALVSGVLWKRIAIGMPLQVDATLFYLLRKSSGELTQDDLALKSPYNTYQNRGLPVGPIGNPGLVAINRAIKPTESPYLYYLSDASGVIHYARTFEEHKANKAKYLK